ncbi:FtsX-like permease family protein [Ruminococcus sp.]|uniref:FtsX-like permease family protein n=1 Tax=Ruminococcus sp. TaxID=41978 RepID=UPI0025FA04C8|nr:FtsX-like permease family protein [Ruminococcus sp.]
MKKISIIKRFGLNGIVFILGLVISSFVLINTIDISSRIAKEDESNNMYSENIQYRLRYCGKSKLSEENCYNVVNDIINSLRDLNCNASIEGVGICINNQIDNMFPKIIINTQDDYKLQLNNNKIVSSNIYEYELIVGESIIKLSDIQNVNQLHVADMSVPIQGVLKNNNAASIDYSILFIYDNCNENLKQYLTNQICDVFRDFNIKVNLYSDYPIDKESNKFIGNMKSLDVACENYISKYKGSDYQNYWYRFYNKIFITICLVFSLFTCFSLSFLWILGRKKEIAIRKAFGFSDFSIFKLLMKDIAKLTVSATLISIVVEIVYCIVFNNLSFFDKYFIVKFLAVYLGASIIGTLCALNLMKEVSKITPISAIREEL